MPDRGRRRLVRLLDSAVIRVRRAVGGERLAKSVVCRERLRNRRRKRAHQDCKQSQQTADFLKAETKHAVRRAREGAMIGADYAMQTAANLCVNHMPGIFTLRVSATGGNASQARCAAAARQIQFHRKIAISVVVNLVRQRGKAPLKRAEIRPCGHSGNKPPRGDVSTNSCDDVAFRRRRFCPVSRPFKFQKAFA